MKIASLGFPSLVRIRRRFDRPVVVDIEGTLTAQLSATGVVIRAGARIALAVGSRGIANLPLMVRTMARWIKAQGGRPFIVPAMGSHGGATVAGQRAILESLGITAEHVEAPVESSMEVIELNRGRSPIPVFIDSLAWQADGIMLLNRIKPHTSFHGPYESGLAKMLTVGLGKHEMAMVMHGMGVDGLRQAIPAAAGEIIRQSRILLGVAVVENAYDQTQLIRAIPAGRILEEEPALLQLAGKAMPRLPLEDVDVLVVDRFGKDISGVGLDTNVIGRMMIRGEPEPPSPRIGIIILRDLTDGSHGNATGMGLADVMLRRVFDKIDFPATLANVYTSGFLLRAKTPVVVDTDLESLTFAMRSLHQSDPAKLKIIRIRDTLHLDELLVSPPVADELRDRRDVDFLGAVGGTFDDAGMMPPFPCAADGA